jgi:hypothetical protein
MNTLVTETRLAKAQNVKVLEDEFKVELDDGRTIMIPLVWYPRLLHGTKKERDNWQLIGKGEGIHWPHLDEDISVEHLIKGIPSGESQRSLDKWLKKRE